MKNIKTFLGTVFLISAITMTACVVQPEHPQGYGPPPQAPAHGYRYKYQDRDMEYDSNLGVYIVLGITGLYFLNEFYYRHDHDGWYSSRRYDRDWRHYDDRDRNLPPGLAKKYHDDDRNGDNSDNHGHDGDDDRGRGHDGDDDHGRGHDGDDDQGHGNDQGHGHDQY